MTQSQQIAQPEPELIPVMDSDSIHKALRRIAHEVIERHPQVVDLIIAGIPTRGVEIARRLIRHIGKVEGSEPEMAVVDVSMHRDDLATRNRLTVVETTRLPVDLEGRTLILVDDVLFTGRSCRAAMDAISSYGRPGRIELAVLIDRGHRELPIRPDYVGKNLPTAREERIRVRFECLDAVPDSVHLVRP